MDRRYYLGGLASALLAGCGGADSSTPDGTPTATTPATVAPQQTPTETLTETDAQTETATPEATETPDEPNPEIESIAAEVAAAFDVYIGSAGGDAALTDIEPTDRINTSDVRDSLFEARDIRGDIDRSALPADEQMRYDQLEGAYWFAWWLPGVHNGIYVGYRLVQSGWDRLLTKDWDNAESEWSDISDGLSDAETSFDRLRNDSESSDMDGFDRLTPEDYTDKVEQLENLKTDMNNLENPLLMIADAFQQFDTGGENAYFNAERNFSDAANTLRDREGSSLHSSLVDDAICVADAMANGCDLLDRAQRTFDDEERQALVEDAQEEFDKCEIVDDDINIEVT